MTSPVSAQSVAWWEVHTHVAPMLDAAGDWPTAGTPEWSSLPSDDPRKLAALLDAARHWALRLETAQEARCEAAHAVSAALDWSALSCAITRRRRCGAYIPREPHG